MDALALTFQRDMLIAVEEMKREISYHPAYFLQMVAEHGAVEASRRLIEARNPSDGFTRLWEAQRLDMTVEAHAILPWYAELFSDEVRHAARERLLAYGFDVDRHVRSAETNPPKWWEPYSRED